MMTLIKLLAQFYHQAYWGGMIKIIEFYQTIFNRFINRDFPMIKYLANAAEILKVEQCVAVQFLLMDNRLPYRIR